MKLPHQVLGAAFGRVRAPGARTAAPKVKNCRTGATMEETEQHIVAQLQVAEELSFMYLTSNINATTMCAYPASSGNVMVSGKSTSSNRQIVRNLAPFAFLHERKGGIFCPALPHQPI